MADNLAMALLDPTALHPLETLNRLFGPDVANTLHDAFAGTRLYVPSPPDAGHPIVKAIGMPAALALSEELGGVSFDIPSNRERRVAALHAQGRTNGEIAQEIGITLRSVRRNLRKCGAVAHIPRRRRRSQQDTGAPATVLSTQGN